MNDLVTPLVGVAPSLLGESPFWHPEEGALYWVDIPGRRLHRFDPRAGTHRSWDWHTEPGCVVPLSGGGLVIALRDGLWRFDVVSGERQRIEAAPYDPASQRFNDGKADPQGRLWLGTVHEAREPLAALYCRVHAGLHRVVDGATTSNGLAWSPDGRTMYWSDTPRHEVEAFDFDPATGMLSRRRVFARFAPRADAQPLERYGGRPDGAAVDVEGAYWVAMYEGARLLRLSPKGDLLREIRLPVRCPTMPCFGGPDLKTLYLTTSRFKRPDDELARDGAAGCVLRLRVEVAGLPVNFARL